MQFTILRGDCLARMQEMADNSVDSIVTDPPYAFTGGFMGKKWDNFDGREDAGFGYWLAGFTDGEGHFRVQKHERGTHMCAFQLKLRDDDLAALERIKRFVGAGSIHFIEGNGSSNRQAVYVVQDKDGCDRLVTLFRKYPLTAKKALDFEIWAEAVEEWLDRPRGNRWAGASDQTRAAALKARLEDVRRYTDIPWSGHKFQDWVRQWAKECMRVLKPGGHLLAFGATRQYHRLTAGIEDAGFEIRDSIAWMYGSGFPKSNNLDGEWKGWGTALKPAHEPICVARKPLTGTVVANVLEFGTGALNIDGCRVATDDVLQLGKTGLASEKFFTKGAAPQIEKQQHDAGRWPANIIHDGSNEVLALFPDTGPSTGGGRKNGDKFGGGYAAPGRDTIGLGDTGSAARFFYCAKASKADRNEGCESLKLTDASEVTGRAPGSAGLVMEGGKANPYAGTSGAARTNSHPTVKPTALMAYLVRLVTPPGGLVLDPFMGSGSTGKACMREGFRFIGIELSDEYADIAEARITQEMVGDLL
jgi:site-specific DNA-methyltransferase (adenine-specific)